MEKRENNVSAKANRRWGSNRENYFFPRLTFQDLQSRTASDSSKSALKPSLSMQLTLDQLLPSEDIATDQAD